MLHEGCAEDETWSVHNMQGATFSQHFNEHLRTGFPWLDWSYRISAHMQPRKPHLTFSKLGRLTEVLMPFKLLNCGEWKSIRPPPCRSKPIQLAPSC